MDIFKAISDFRHYKTGDYITISSFSYETSQASAIDSQGRDFYIDLQDLMHYFVKCNDSITNKLSTKTKCICNSRDLFHFGCKCGGF